MLLAAAAVLALILWRAVACACGGTTAVTVTFGPVPPAPIPSLTGDGVKVGTFLGNYSRRFYGLGPVPQRLDVLWKVRLGEGWTSGKAATDPPGKWAGSGWTGMPNVVVDKGKTYIVVGGYDHRLRRLDAVTGDVVWEYKYDDIIKSSPSVFKNPQPTGADDAYIVCAGSRRGYPLTMDDPNVAPYRAVTFGSGRELWRLPVPKTASYSRDTDGSGFYLDGRQYIGVESGWFYALDPLQTAAWNGFRRPQIVAQRLLLGDERAASHHGNLVLESSASVLGSLIYVAGAATSPCSGTTSPAPTSTAPWCPRAAASCSCRWRSSTSRGTAGCCAWIPPSPPRPPPSGSSPRPSARWGSGAGA